MRSLDFASAPAQRKLLDIRGRRTSSNMEPQLLCLFWKSRLLAYRDCSGHSSRAVKSLPTGRTTTVILRPSLPARPATALPVSDGGERQLSPLPALLASSWSFRVRALNCVLPETEQLLHLHATIRQRKAAITTYSSSYSNGMGSSSVLSIESINSGYAAQEQTIRRRNEHDKATNLRTESDAASSMGEIWEPFTTASRSCLLSITRWQLAR